MEYVVFALLLVVALVMWRFSYLTQRTLRKVNATLEHQAMRDELTGLWNRRAFANKLEECLAELDERCFSLLMIDLDHFKEINDKHGHQVGDDVLEHISAILRRSIRRVDFAARYGGEEFLIIIMDADGVYASQLAERIRFEIESNPDREHFNAKVTASIGVVDLRGINERTARAVLEGVDKALYMAKESGRNRIFRGDRYISSIPPVPRLPKV